MGRRPRSFSRAELKLGSVGWAWLTIENEPVVFRDGLEEYWKGKGFEGFVYCKWEPKSEIGESYWFAIDIEQKRLP